MSQKANFTVFVPNNWLGVVMSYYLDRIIITLLLFLMKLVSDNFSFAPTMRAYVIV